jgi:hypothetical protein
MKHAGAAARDGLSDLLESLRTRTGLVERRRGIFYIRGQAFLHFHEDRAGLFADLRQSGDWQRLPVNGPDDCARLLVAVDQTLGRLQGTANSKRRISAFIALALTAISAASV